MKKKSDSLFYILSKRSVVVLIVFYCALITISIFLSIRTILVLPNIPHTEIIIHTIIASFSVSSMLSSVQYLKRIYKAAITDRIISPEKSPSYEHIGNLLYFLLRPVFSLIFVIVMIFVVLSGFAIVTGTLDYVINIRFLYLCVIFSAFIGYSFGHLLDRFESYSNKQIDKAFEKAEEDKHYE